MNPQPGQSLGRYQILGPLGVGGMATVYRERFAREARAVARLRQPNIVRMVAR